MRYNKKGIKPPSYMAEFTFVSVNLFFLKLYSSQSYEATSFFSIMIPIMIYMVITLFGNLLKFIQLMHIEDPVDGDTLMSKKQTKVLVRVLGSLMCYFGLYFLACHLDIVLKPSDDLDKLQILPAFIGIELAFIILLYQNRVARNEYISRQKSEDLEGGVGASLFSSTGLTTIFNAMTQTTTTLCANGQCFTIYSNTIASNLAAFGVSMTAITTYLMPICFLLVSYSVWTLYREKR